MRAACARLRWTQERKKGAPCPAGVLAPAGRPTLECFSHTKHSTWALGLHTSTSARRASVLALAPAGSVDLCARRMTPAGAGNTPGARPASHPSRLFARQSKCTHISKPYTGAVNYTPAPPHLLLSWYPATRMKRQHLRTARPATLEKHANRLPRHSIPGCSLTLSRVANGPGDRRHTMTLCEDVINLGRSARSGYSASARPSARTKSPAGWTAPLAAYERRRAGTVSACALPDGAAAPCWDSRTACPYGATFARPCLPAPTC